MCIHKVVGGGTKWGLKAEEREGRRERGKEGRESQVGGGEEGQERSCGEENGEVEGREWR
jgi:hypothetical protein